MSNAEIDVLTRALWIVNAALYGWFIGDRIRYVLDLVA